MHRVLLPKAVDRVFTILVDEGDFIPLPKDSLAAAQTSGIGGEPDALSLDGKSHTVDMTPALFSSQLGLNDVLNEKTLDRVKYSFQ